MNIKRKFALVAISIMIMFFVYGCNKDDHDHSELITGKQLFNYHCLSCHREKGQGSFLRGVPSNNDTELSTYQVFHKIRKSTNNSKMPSFPTMSKEEALKISYYLKEIANQ